MTTNASKVWVVLFFDADESISHLFTFTYDSDTAPIEKWAKGQIASDRALFANSRSAPRRYCVYGSTIDTLYLREETRLRPR
jgi:hypothetical protein